MNKKILFDWENKRFTYFRSNIREIVVSIYVRSDYFVKFNRLALVENLDIEEYFKLTPILKHKTFTSLGEAKNYADSCLKSIGCVFATNKAKLLL